jgi:hypothetical protein
MKNIFDIFKKKKTLPPVKKQNITYWNFTIAIEGKQNQTFSLCSNEVGKPWENLINWYVSGAYPYYTFDYNSGSIHLWRDRIIYLKSEKVIREE